MPASSFVHVDCDLLARTDKAVCVLHEGRKHWIPFSQLAPGECEKVARLFDQAEEGEPVEGCTLSMSEWIAEQKGIEPE